MYALYQLQQEEGADVMDHDAADVMDADEVGAKALAVLDDGREAPEAYQALLLSLVGQNSGYARVRELSQQFGATTF